MTAAQTVLIPRALDHRELAAVFHLLFEQPYRTRLVGGALEPLYQPATGPGEFHTIFYTRDYAASVLHEVAHWCVAGPARRLQEDYGYWYAPDGRNAEQQRLFEQVEVRPQALEWIFSVAARREFRVSADNLEAGLGASDSFCEAIFEQVRRYCRDGLPPRANAFAHALAARTGSCAPLTSDHYRREALL